MTKTTPAAFAQRACRKRTKLRCPTPDCGATPDQIGRDLGYGVDPDGTAGEMWCRCWVCGVRFAISNPSALPGYYGAKEGKPESVWVEEEKPRKSNT